MVGADLYRSCRICRGDGLASLGQFNSQAEAAFDLYEEILSITLVEEGDAFPLLTARVIELADSLRSDHGSSIYAKFAISFLLSRRCRTMIWQLPRGIAVDSGQSSQGVMGEVDEGLILTASCVWAGDSGARGRRAGAGPVEYA